LQKAVYFEGFVLNIQADVALIAACQQGDAHAIREIFDLYKDRVYALCRHMAGNTEDAEDLTQEIFVSAFQHLDHFRAAVACIDWATDVLLHELKDLGLDDNTLVIFTSDNGSRARDEGGSNAPLLATKGTTWEGGQRVPCIMRWPGKIPAGQTSNELTLSMDFYPTLAQLGNAPIPTDRIIDGKDIRPLMFAAPNAQSQHDAFFYYKRNSIEAVRSGQWKLHIRKDDEEINELYNLENDIGETNNVYDQHPDIVQNLLAKIDTCRQDIGDEAAGVAGQNIRPIGRVENPDTLTHYDPDHPYFIAMYDLKERG
jgi:arylsulfatase A